MTRPSNFVSGRSAKKRKEFQELLEDSKQDKFDVLLVDHTSRFGRNQAECIQYKQELRNLSKIVVFVSQGIISGSDRDFLSERINETLDEQYSRNLSRYVSAGMAEKAKKGLANGAAPLGYKSEFSENPRRERKAVDPATMPTLLALLKDYASSGYSFKEVADRLNAQGLRMRTGRLFSGYSIRDVLDNRFYEGKVVYHKDLSDEMVINGSHVVPDEVKELWLKCQDIKKERVTKVGYPRGENHDFPFSLVLKCQLCGSPYHGEAVHYRGRTVLRLTHERRMQGRDCKTWPRSRSVESLNQEFGERVLKHLHLDDGWKTMVAAALKGEKEVKNHDAQRDKLHQAIQNLRKQHLWGDISDADYRHDKMMLDRQLKTISPANPGKTLPNLERAAQLINDLPSLWAHSGVADKQREELVQEIFTKITIDGKNLAQIEPKPSYAPLFAAVLAQQNVGYHDLKSISSPPETLMTRLEFI